MTGKDI